MSKTINIEISNYLYQKRKLINDENKPFGKDTVFDEVKFEFLIMKLSQKSFSKLCFFNCLRKLF